MTAPRAQLVVFARAPRYGTVKSRLAAEIGTAGARQAYRAMTAAVLAQVGDTSLWKTEIAVTPGTCRGGRFWGTQTARCAQGAGDLGRRMATALAERACQGPVAIVGTDIPAMTRGHVRAAFDLLLRHDVVFGPAADGGYWLVGVRQRLPQPVIDRLFANVRWSTADALGDTLRNLRPGLRAGFAATLGDVDTAEDLLSWRRSHEA